MVKAMPRAIKAFGVLKIAVCIHVCLATWPASAADMSLPIIWGPKEKIAKVTDFPNTDTYKATNGNFVDAGVKYTTFEVFAIPLYNYNQSWAGYVGRDDTYMRMTRDELMVLATSAGVTLPRAPPLPFWDAWGGKLIAAGLLLSLIYFAFLGLKVRNDR